MENKRILVTGHRGFLCSRLVEELSSNNELIRFGGDIRESRLYTHIDVVMHFASPSEDIEFSNKLKTATTIIDGTINLLQIAKDHKAKFIFASSMGVYDASSDNLYGSYKLAMENYIRSVYNDYIILRIPRVYGASRVKGLMRKLRECTVPEHDMDKELDFITLDEFAQQTLSVIDATENTIYLYDVLHKETITEIKQRFV